MSTLWMLPALPAFGAVVLLLGGRRCNTWGHLVATAAAVSSFVVAVSVLIAMLGRDETSRALTQTLFRWVPVDELQVDFGLRADQLTICFVLLITGVGSLIHVYSIGYMSHDPERRRFFAYLNLFLAAMLLLVLADNFLGLYVGWEGVGLASYLLIGFWQHKPSAASAARKAFVVNRVGDIGLAIALMIMFVHFGSVQYDVVFAGIGEAGESVATALALMLLLAACGKSAQVPLQSWLGDAMEGPTPVSALIHAATMVTAGVYLIVRSGPIFEASPVARAATVTVGAVTLLFGAVIGCAKDDIKKALAASTMSQIGYMVLAAGLGPSGYAIAIVLLLSHGFFKAGLFLGAGSVMHAMNDETDMRRFGGLRAAMPITFATFGLGYLAIIGVPPFSGFFAKDPIIEVAFAAGGATGVVLGCVTLLGAGLTAFYMTRVMLMTFFGPKRWAAQAHPHEASATMTVPMIVLAIGSVASGAFLAVGGRLEAWLEPVVGTAHEEHAISAWVVTVAVLAVVLMGASLAYRNYIVREVPPNPPEDVSSLTKAARADLYGDAVNEAVFMRPGQKLTRTMVYADTAGIDAVVDGVGRSIGRVSTRTRRLQTGFVRSYALAMFAGAVLVVLMVVVL